jgi:hypothetical protein
MMEEAGRFLRELDEAIESALSAERKPSLKAGRLMAICSRECGSP